MLDINICIYIRQRRPEEVLRRFRKLRPGEAVLFGHHLRHLGGGTGPRTDAADKRRAGPVICATP